MMMGKKAMPSSGGPMGGSPISDSKPDGDEGESDDGMGGKLLALQNMIGAIADISDDELKPYIENLKNQIHAGHEAAEGDDMGVQEAAEHDASSPDGMPPKSGLDVTIGMGVPKPGMPGAGSSDEDEDEEGMPPKAGFLAILAKKMKKGK